MGNQKTLPTPEPKPEPVVTPSVKPAPEVEPVERAERSLLAAQLSGSLAGAGTPPPDAGVLGGSGLAHATGVSHRAALARSLQRRHGNVFVQRAVRQHKASENTVLRPVPTLLAQRPEIRQHLFIPGVQTKLTVGAPNDIYEQEADRVADTVMRVPEPRSTAADAGRTHFPGNQTQAAPGQTPKVTPKVESYLNASRGGGQPLLGAVRTSMEKRFEQDFSGVRVHTDPQAADVARELNAQAFTSGQDIYFGPGRYQPSTPQGQRLLAHELTHTIQKTSDPLAIQRGLWDRIGGATRRLVGASLGALLPGTGGALTAVSSGLSNLGQFLGIPRLTGKGPALLSSILSLLSNPIVRALPGFLFPSVLRDALQRSIPLLETAWEIFTNPDRIVARIRSALGEMIHAAAERARSIATSAVSNDYVDCVLRHLNPKLEYMYSNWWTVLKEMGWELIWPWPGVKQDFDAIWKRIQSLGTNLWHLDFSRAADDYLSILRHLNAAAGRLYGWFLIGSVLVGAIKGGIVGAKAYGVGAIPGALVGAARGLAIAGKVGMVLLGTTVAIEGASILKAADNLTRDDRTDEEKECDCELIASSGLTVALCLVMWRVGVLAGRFAKAIIQRIGKKVWRLPSRRQAGRRSMRTRRMQGRRDRQPESRGDVLEARFALAKHVRNLFSRKRVRITDAYSTADNFPGIDLTVDAQIQVRSQTTGQVLGDLGAFDAAIAAGERIEVTVNGGNIYQVKSHGPIKNLVGTISREIQTTGRFQQGTFSRRHTVRVQNPTQRILVVFLEKPLAAGDLARLNTIASQNGVRLQITTDPFPPGHPAVIPAEELPAVLGQLGAEGSRVVDEGEECERVVECEL